ncbi:MAG: squalene/phytoene synthase family protein [Paracoccaceae bacterium]
MSLDACAALVAKGDPDRFSSAMTAPLEARGGLLALYAFNLEVARAPWVSSEAGINEIRLQWWADAIDEIYEGKPVRAHEVVAPLGAEIVGHGLPKARFDALIAARRHDIYTDRFEDLGAVLAYCEATSGGLMALAAATLGATDNEVAATFGTGVGVANLIVAMPQLIAAGRNPLPKGDDAEMLRALAQQGMALINATRKQRRAIPKAARPAMLAGWRANGPLRAARANPQRCLQTPWAGSEFQRRLWLMVRAATGYW